MKRDHEFRRAVDALDRARAELSRARQRLASVALSANVDAPVPTAWRWKKRLLDTRSAKLLARPGVIGHGLGERRHNGVRTGEGCATIFVSRKLGLPELDRRGRKALPKHIVGKQGRLRTDVVRLGKLVRLATLGASIGPVNDVIKGTLGAIATDLATGKKVAITAMHVSGYIEYPHAGTPPIHFQLPSRLDSVSGAALGTLGRGSMRGIDAATIALSNPDGIQAQLPFIGPVRGWRPVSHPADDGIPVRMCGATSGYQQGVIEYPSVALHDPAFDLDEAILVSIGANHGDSGAALVDNQNLVLGFLVGRAGPDHRRLQVFCPASRIFARLSCEISNP